MTCEPWVHDVRVACRGFRRPGLYDRCGVDAGCRDGWRHVDVRAHCGCPAAASSDAGTGPTCRDLEGASGYRFDTLACQCGRARRDADANHVFARRGRGIQRPDQTEIVEGSSTEYIQTARVTGDFFDVLGMRPFLGRPLNPADDFAGAERVLVLTNGLWQRRYGGAADVVGRRVTIGDERFVIVGVMSPDVEYPLGVDAWMTVEARVTLTGKPLFRKRFETN